MDEYRPIAPYLEPTQKVTLVDPSDDSGFEYDAEVYDWDRETLTISESEDFGDLPSGEEIIARVFTDRGVLEFQTKVVERLRASSNWVISRPSRARRIQRRRFLRMDIEGELKVEPGSVEPDTDAQTAGKPVQEQGQINISANGIRFVTDRKDFNLSARYELHIHIEFEEGPVNPRINQLDVEVVGEVVRMTSIHSEDETLYEVAMKFVEIDQEMQDNLVRFLLRYQLHLRRHEVDVV